MPVALPPHVLIAEDDPLGASALETFLRFSGYRITLAEDGLQALAAFERTPADLLITDIMMPGLDGNGLIRELWGRRPELPVVVITGDAARLRPEYRPPLVSHRLALLAKPVKPSHVIDALQTFLSEQQEQATAN